MLAVIIYLTNTMQASLIRILIICSFLSIVEPAFTCDSTMFKTLIDYSSNEYISEKEFLICKDLVDSLWAQGCDDYLKRINNQNVAITSLTYTFGKICYIANSELATKSYIEYLLKNKKSAEEQLSFSFEYLFTLKPNVILREISKLNEDDQEFLLRQLVWGFINNRSYGIVDPYENNPYKAFTYYRNPPEIILDTTNYKEIFAKVNPSIQNNTEFAGSIEYILEEIYNWLKFIDKMNKENNKNSNQDIEEDNNR